MSEPYECVIIGGGPGGLTAAEYLGRFLRRTLVIDSGESRARWIPVSHNYPGFPQGISGEEMLQRLRRQAGQYDVAFHQGRVTSVRQQNDLFTIECEDETFQAFNVIVASGVEDEVPALPGLEKFIYDGTIRFCPICDGFEAIDKVIGIIGPCANIYRKARFLRSYSANLRLFALDDNFACSPQDCEALCGLGIELPTCSVRHIEAKDNAVTVTLKDGTTETVEILYPAMGSKIRTDFLAPLGINSNDSGCIYTDSAQETNIKGVYAIGDITLDLSQISVATGQAAIAATAIHNSLPLNPRRGTKS